MTTTLTPDEIEALKNKIADAESAYHALMTGTMAVVHVDQNGERVEFARQKRSDLWGYILTLKAQLPQTDGCASVYGKPLGFLF